MTPVLLEAEPQLPDLNTHVLRLSWFLRVPGEPQIGTSGPEPPPPQTRTLILETHTWKCLTLSFQ